jgi:hypothetical protein
MRQTGNGEEGRGKSGTRGRTGTVAVLITLLAASTAHAQAPASIVTDRPDQTESSLTVPHGSVQLEAGWTMTRSGGTGVGTRDHALPETLLRIGAGRRGEVRLGFGGWQRRVTTIAGLETVQSGLGDVEVGFKYRLTPAEGPRPVVALLADVALPTGAAGFTGGQVSPVVRLAVAHELAERVGTAYNAGVSVFQAGAGTGIEAIYTWTVGLSLSERIGAFAETFGTVNLSGGETRMLLDGGFTLQLRPNLQLDLAGGVGLNDAADDWFFGAGLSARLPK